MTTVDFITELFIKVDDEIDDDKHPQATLYPSEVVTLALLYALKGSGQLAFWRWLTRDYGPSELSVVIDRNRDRNVPTIIASVG